MHTLEMSSVQLTTRKLQTIISGTSLDNAKLLQALQLDVYDSKSQKLNFFNALNIASEPSYITPHSVSPRSSSETTAVSNPSLSEKTPSKRQSRPRVLIIFIRHFLCGNCQEYLLRLSSHPLFRAANLSKHNVKVAIVGCGTPSHISSYRTLTKLPSAWTLYADPSTELYNALDMQRSLKLGDRRPAYIQRTLTGNMLRSVLQGVRRVPLGDVGKAGSWDVNGGEYLLELGNAPDNCQVRWCHQMENSRDHTEVEDLVSIVGLNSTPSLPTSPTFPSDSPKIHARTFSTPLLQGNRPRPDELVKGQSPLKRQSSLRKSLSVRRQSWFGVTNRYSKDKDTKTDTSPIR